MNYFKSIQKYFLILFFSVLTFQSSFSQTISPPFQQVPAVPPSGFEGSVFFNINATGEWFVKSLGGYGSGSGNGTYTFNYRTNETPEEQTYAVELYDLSTANGSVSSVTVTPNIITFPPSVNPNDGFLQANTYFLGDPLSPSYFSARFQQVSGNDYEIIVDISDAGLGYTDAQYPIRMVGGGSGTSIQAVGATPALFVADANGELVWNTATGVKTLSTSVAGTDGEVQYTGGEGYFAPPNIAGWQAFYQSPQYHLLWINADALPKRQDFAKAIIGNGIQLISYVPFAFKSVTADVFEFVKKLNNPEDPNALILELNDYLLGITLSPEHREKLKTDHLLSGQMQDYYWTDAWINAIIPGASSNDINTVVSRLKSLLDYLVRLEEFQLM